MGEAAFLTHKCLFLSSLTHTPNSKKVYLLGDIAGLRKPQYVPKMKAPKPTISPQPLGPSSKKLSLSAVNLDHRHPEWPGQAEAHSYLASNVMLMLSRHSVQNDSYGSISCTSGNKSALSLHSGSVSAVFCTAYFRLILADVGLRLHVAVCLLRQGYS